jgi:hypothetical protein
MAAQGNEHAFMIPAHFGQTLHIRHEVNTVSTPSHGASLAQERLIIATCRVIRKVLRAELAPN